MIHAALMLGVIFFGAVAWYTGSSRSVPSSDLPERKTLYLGLFMVSAVAFSAAMYTAGRITPRDSRISNDEWWRTNVGRVIPVWALIEAPTLLGIVAYLFTNDFRVLLASFIGLLFFVNYRPSRFADH